MALLQQLRSTGFLPREIGWRVRLGDVLVRSRIPLPVIGAVKDSAELVGVLANDGIQTRPVFRQLNFASVSFADGRNRIGKHDAALEEIEIPVEFNAAGSEV